MKSGGARTLQECAETGKGETPLTAEEFRGMMRGAMSSISCIHHKNWIHRDYQMKNIMSSASCAGDDVRVVDIDGMKEADDRKGVWGGNHRMFHDLRMLFGTPDSGASPLNSFPGDGTAAKEEAQRIYDIVVDIMAPYEDIYDYTKFTVRRLEAKILEFLGDEPQN